MLQTRGKCLQITYQSLSVKDLHFGTRKVFSHCYHNKTNTVKWAKDFNRDFTQKDNRDGK